jgi:hypothetical protein
MGCFPTCNQHEPYQFLIFQEHLPAIARQPAESDVIGLAAKHISRRR